MCVSDGHFQNETGYAYVEINHYRGDPLFDPCVGNQCAEGEVCESLQNKKVVCLMDDCKIPNEEPQDVALGKFAYQSSQIYNQWAKYAIDGLYNTYQFTATEMSPYWWVDLGNIYNMMRIKIINMSGDGHGHRLHDLDISVGPCLDDLSVFAHYKGPGKSGEHLVFQRRLYTDGRFVKLSIINVLGALNVHMVNVFAYPIC
ncbi:Hypothetical predicted protein [Mytilus galloprovincialis]|uniref:Fucolectin tachylectin-4 pentraxin-1 domain-containing protein n=1 Tax=Mytilus galloprovincialis TaxID=29158 RepID=A0A8B6ELS1_MYTGA|nr:Hypothetical predicted protein [Mytilus galloprovincialis]